MSLRPILALCATTILAACPAAPTVTSPAPGAPESPAEPPLVVGGGEVRPTLERFTLANGLDVYLLPDRGAPLVCVQVWVKTGSANEHEGPRRGEGTTGLSHFFEHLMFQGTERFPDYDLALAPLGARNNAFTYQDATVFWAYTPKEHLAHILDIEADRFQHMKVDFLHLEPEREVVKSERRQHTDADAGELAEERAVMRTFDASPYRWGTIGWMEDLDAVPLEVAQRYHAEHYTTTGAYLVIAGDFDGAAARAAIEATFGQLARPATPPGPPSPSGREVVDREETWIGPRTDHLVLPVEQPIVYWTYRVPAPGGASEREFAALELIDHALSAGKAGRLTRQLVYAETPKLARLSASLTALRRPWIWRWRADLLDGVTTAEIERAIDDELRSVAEHGLTADEIARAAASLRTDALSSNLGNSDKAETIGWSIAATGDPFALYSRLAIYPTITVDELKAFASKYLVPARRVRVVVIAPERIRALAEHLGALDPAAGPLAGFLTAASALFGEALDLKARRAEIERERTAIALLLQRADTAKTGADKATRAAIDRYLSQGEMGARARQRRNDAEATELARAEAALAKKQAALIARLRQTVRTAAPSYRGRDATRAIEMLATPLDRPIDVPAVVEGLTPGVPHAPALGQRAALPTGQDGAERLALQVLASFALEARGLDASAESARDWVLWSGAKHTGGDAAARALVGEALALANDARRMNLDLGDKPQFLPTTPLGERLR